MVKKLLLLIIGVVFTTTGCNLRANRPEPTVDAQAIFTQAARTVEAELTRVSNFPTFSPNPPTATSTDTPTPTITYTPTNTPIPCNLGTFNPSTIDVTIPDNMVMAPNQVFSKTWRIRNAGSCSWNSNYLVVFKGGDTLGVTSGYTQQLTSGIVYPGQEVDITVNNLKAPSTNGTYSGQWKLHNSNGNEFGITPAGGTFIVKIVVVATSTKTLEPVSPGIESGTIRADGGPWTDFTTGESNADVTKTCEAFLSFDISSIPKKATIVDVSLDFTAYTIEGAPFASLGPMNAYVANYGALLEPGDFVSGFPPGNIADWGSTDALNMIESSPELKAYLQSILGGTRLQLRLQFADANGGTKDRVTLTSPKMIVKYITP